MKNLFVFFPPVFPIPKEGKHICSLLDNHQHPTVTDPFISITFVWMTDPITDVWHWPRACFSEGSHLSQDSILSLRPLPWTQTFEGKSPLLSGAVVNKEAVKLGMKGDVKSRGLPPDFLSFSATKTAPSGGGNLQLEWRHSDVLEILSLFWRKEWDTTSTPPPSSVLPSSLLPLQCMKKLKQPAAEVSGRGRYLLPSAQIPTSVPRLPLIHVRDTGKKKKITNAHVQGTCVLTVQGAHVHVYMTGRHVDMMALMAVASQFKFFSFLFSQKVRYFCAPSR